jgi:hypothetical protein
MGTLGTASYTHSGTGVLTWAATAAGNQSISSNTASTSSDTITGSAGNDTLTGNEGTNTLVGGLANDTLKGNGGADSLSGGAGNDGITAGGGADTVTAGLGIDTIALAETTAAADVVQITAGAVGTAGDNDAKFITNTSLTAVDDRGEITLSGFDAGLDTLSITATNVNNFEHTTDLLVSAPAATGTGTNANNVDSFVANTLFIALDGDAAVNDSDDIVVTFSDFKLSGVNQLGAADLLTTADIDQSIVYNLTGTGAADTITGGTLGDTIVGGAGIDTIDLGSDTAVDKLTIAKVAIAGSAAGADLITNYDAGEDDIIVLDSAFAWSNGTTNGTVVLATHATNFDGLHGVNANFSIGTIGANVTGAHTITTFLAGGSNITQLEGEIATRIGTATNANAANTDKVLIAIDDGAHTALVLFESAADGNAVAAGEISVIGILQGLTDATTLAAGDFSFT